MPERQGNLCSKQAQHLKFKWLQRGSEATITLIRKRTLNHLAKLAKFFIQNLKKELKIGIPISTGRGLIIHKTPRIQLQHLWCYLSTLCVLNLKHEIKPFKSKLAFNKNPNRIKNTYLTRIADQWTDSQWHNSLLKETLTARKLISAKTRAKPVNWPALQFSRLVSLWFFTIRYFQTDFDPNKCSCNCLVIEKVKWFVFGRWKQLFWMNIIL